MMKQAPKVEVIEVDGEGLVSMFGKQVEVRCAGYIYAGILVGVNTNYIKLDRMAIVYETGPFGDAKYKDAQIVGDSQYVMAGAIESFGECTKTYPGRD